jgi:hypothetical protein
MSDINKKLEDFVSSYEGDAVITLKIVADANGCSIDQVRRRVGDLVKAKKELFKKPVKEVRKNKAKANELDNSALMKIMDKMSIIEASIKELRSELKEKNPSNPWFESLNFTTDKEQLVDIKVNDSIITGEYGAIHEVYSCFSEEKDLEWDRVDRKHDAGWLSDEKADSMLKEIENRSPFSNEYTQIRISNRQSSQLEKKLNRIIRKIGA